MTWKEYISTYPLTPEQHFILQNNGGRTNLEWESFSGGDMSYHVYTINAIARGIHAKTIVELGVRNGQSTRALLYAVALNDGIVHSIDIEDCNHVCPLPILNLWKFYQMTTDKFYEEYYNNLGEIDLLMIDADHSYEQSIKDFENYSKNVRTNGFILMHDVYPAKECRKKWPGGAGGVWKTWLEIKEKYLDKYEMVVLPYCSGLGIIRVTNGYNEIPNGKYFGRDIDSLRYSPNNNDGHRGIYEKEEFEESFMNKKIYPFDFVGE